MILNFTELQEQALMGDHEAIAEIRDLALRAICVLDSLTGTPAGHPEIPEELRAGVAAAHDVAKHSPRWPVALNSVKEIREADLAQWHRLEAGSKLGIRLTGKNRKFSYGEQTGFALNVFNELEAIRKTPERHRHLVDIDPVFATPGFLTDEQLNRSWQNLAAVLAPLAKDSLSAWVAAGTQYCREQCDGDWSRFPWPDCVQSKVGKDSDGNGSLRTTESAIAEKLTAGLKNLI